MLNRRCFIAAMVLAPLVRPAVAADWPQRPVRIVYPYGPGGSGDAMARVLAARLSDVFGRAFVIENKPGANGTLAAETVARSPADGYTLLFALTPQIAIAPAMMAHVIMIRASQRRPPTLCRIRLLGTSNRE